MSIPPHSRRQRPEAGALSFGARQGTGPATPEACPRTCRPKRRRRARIRSDPRSDQLDGGRRGRQIDRAHEPRREPGFRLRSVAGREFDWRDAGTDECAKSRNVGCAERFGGDGGRGRGPKSGKPDKQRRDGKAPNSHDRTALRASFAEVARRPRPSAPTIAPAARPRACRRSRRAGGLGSEPRPADERG